MAASPEQLHELLTYCLDFARTMLEKAGEFHPFGATLSQDGKVAAVGGYNGEEHPKAQEIYGLLADAFRSGAGTGEFLGVALAANVNIPAQFSPVLPDGDLRRFFVATQAVSLGSMVAVSVQFRRTSAGGW